MLKTLLIIAVLFLCVVIDFAQPKTAANEDLKFVVILTRHGVRSPTWPVEQLNHYSSEPWPTWSVPPGNLTAHGKKLIELLGAYNREALAKDGLIKSENCEDKNKFFIRADTDQRTLETGRALADGMMPGCAIEVQSVPEGKSDPLFSALESGIGKPDSALATAAVMGRVGAHPEALTEAYRSDLETLQNVILNCKPGPQCPAAGKQVLLDVPAAVQPGKKDKLVELEGPLAVASTLAQDLLLEYVEGMPDKSVGWGRINIAGIRDLLQLYVAYSDLMRKTPAIARPRTSNLLSHVLQTFRQAILLKPQAGALGKPEHKVVILVGHDTTLSNVAGLLNLSWLLPGDVRDDTPPGGALFMELWHNRKTGKYSVKFEFQSQTLEQMRNASPLTLASPPSRVPIFVSGCSAADEQYSCEWEKFKSMMEKAIDPAFVKP